MPKFTRTKEDFICEKCQEKVIGDGYTNHCPKCLWSKHVDLNPGDREALCHGMMKPVEIEMKRGDYAIIHECIVCKHRKKNALSKRDNLDAAISLAASKAS